MSPFFLGPCRLYGGFTSRNVENGWQYSKVYAEHTDGEGNPTDEYFIWARDGWGQTRAVRYPMEKGRKPLYSWWDGEKLTYVEARKRVYVPLYARAVVKTEAFAQLEELYREKDEITLRDFDGYDYVAQGKSFKEVINDPEKKMGHAFVLAMMLMYPKWTKRITHDRW